MRLTTVLDFQELSSWNSWATWFPEWSFAHTLIESAPDNLHSIVLHIASYPMWWKWCEIVDPRSTTCSGVQRYMSDQFFFFSFWSFGHDNAVFWAHCLEKFHHMPNKMFFLLPRIETCWNFSFFDLLCHFPCMSEQYPMSVYIHI